ncbi:hypothetical protein H1C71_039218 [Ictidomys tridecemlineatus]|nr:hypothetical protein H1C71_039218 [Ictidomys tridecemlineatus]
MGACVEREQVGEGGSVKSCWSAVLVWVWLVLQRKLAGSSGGVTFAVGEGECYLFLRTVLPVSAWPLPSLLFLSSLPPSFLLSPFPVILEIEPRAALSLIAIQLVTLPTQLPESLGLSPAPQYWPCFEFLLFF